MSQSNEASEVSHRPHGLWFLIGYRGTGKTTLARLLAERLGWNWLDADWALEQHHGRNIRSIFAEEGEEGFRNKETAVLAELCKLDRHVIATGGGVVLRAENRERLRSSGKVIWLTGEPAILWRRLQMDESTAQRRPDLAQGGLAEIEELLRIREPLYAACAHITVDTAARSPEEVAEAILQMNPIPGASQP